MRRYVRTVVGVLILAVALVYACAPFGRPIRCELPEGYQGFYGLQEGNPSCPLLRNDSIDIVVSIPVIGCACTSDELPNLWRYHHVVAVRPDGSIIQSNLENIAYASASRQQAYLYPFTIGFIGDRQQLNAGAFGSEVELETRCGWRRT